MKVLILLTDGQHTYIPGFTEPATVAMELRQQHDVDIFAIGIGQEVNFFIFIEGEGVLRCCVLLPLRIPVFRIFAQYSLKFNDFAEPPRPQRRTSCETVRQILHIYTICEKLSRKTKIVARIGNYSTEDIPLSLPSMFKVEVK